MGMREKLDSNRVIGFLVAAILLAAATVQAAYFFWGASPKHQSATDAYYTDDDGRTYFIERIYKFPPWDHNGKEANIAMVYSSSSGNFVGYQLRYTAAARKELVDLYAKAEAGQCPLADVNRLMTTERVGVAGKEAKMRGADKWVPMTSMPRPIPVKAPDGSDVMMVMP
jgi:hypothetical protein